MLNPGAKQYTSPTNSAKKCFISSAASGDITTTVNKCRRVGPMISLLLLDVYVLQIVGQNELVHRRYFLTGCQVLQYNLLFIFEQNKEVVFNLVKINDDLFYEGYYSSMRWQRREIKAMTERLKEHSQDALASPVSLANAHFSDLSNVPA